MANLISKIKRIFTPKQEKRCPVCKRNLQDAITEQVGKKELCGVDHCPFKQEIEQVVLYSRKPELVCWGTDKNIAFDNEDVILSWEVKYARKAEISHLQEVEEQGHLTIRLHEDVDLKLEYESYNGEKFESDTVSIKVMPFPVIHYFATKEKIERGDLVKLCWQVENAIKIEIYDGVNYIDISNNNEYETCPLTITIFKLIVTALDDKTTIENEITVEVFEKPQIRFFKAEPNVVLDCNPVTLSWSVENAKRVEIDNGIGEVEPNGSKKSVIDNKHTFFTLIAYGELSSCIQEITVRIFPTPIIESLSVPMPDFESRINLYPIQISTPKIDISTPKVDVAINLPKFNYNLPQFTEPNVDLRKIKPLYKPEISIFNSIKIYEYVRRKSRKEKAKLV
jgi:hypothetical protein